MPLLVANQPVPVLQDVQGEHAQGVLGRLALVFAGRASPSELLVQPADRRQALVVELATPRQIPPARCYQLHFRIGVYRSQRR